MSASVVEPMLEFFRSDLDPTGLMYVARPYRDMAYVISGSIPPSAERTVALRKLLESRDAAIRAAMIEVKT